MFCHRKKKKKGADSDLNTAGLRTFLLRLQMESPHPQHVHPQPLLLVEMNDRSMIRSIVIKFLFWKAVDKHESCLKKKKWFFFINQYSHYRVNTMDLFNLNGSLLLFFAGQLQLQSLIQQKKNRKLWQRKNLNTDHNFSDGTFTTFSLLFSLFLFNGL